MASRWGENIFVSNNDMVVLMGEYSNAAFLERVEREARYRKQLAQTVEQERHIADLRILQAIADMKNSRAYLWASAEKRREMREKVYNHRLGRFI